MGDKNFMGGLMGGLAHGMQQQRETGLKESIAKAQMDLIKVQAKHEEQKVKTALALDQFRTQYFGQGAGQGGAGGQAQPGGQAAGAPYVGLNDPWTKEAAAAKLFLDVNLPAPNMRPSVTQLKDGRVVTSLNGKIIGTFDGPVEMERVMGTGPGGVPTAYHLPKQFTYPGSSQPAPGGGLGAQPPQLTGTPVGARPMEYAPTTGTGNEENMRPVPKVPMPGEDYQKTPPKKMMMQMVPEAINQKITLEYDPMIRQLEYLKNSYVGSKGEDTHGVFGLGAQTKFSAAENPYLRAGMPIVGQEPSSELIDFHKTMKRVENFEVHNFGGSNLTYTELKRALSQIPRTNNPKDFAVAVDAATRAYKAYKDSVYDFYSKPESARGSGTPLAPKSSLPPGAKPTNHTSGGKPVYELPDGRYWVQ